MVYGHPRLTLDVNLVIRLPADTLPTFSALWPPVEFYCPPFEVLAEERDRPRDGYFNLIHHATGMRADVYLAGTDELQSWALEHPVVREIEGLPVRFAPIEYVIVYKLRYAQAGGSDRHLRDVTRMLEISGAEIDRPALEDWIRRLGLDQEWAKARSRDWE